LSLLTDGFAQDECPPFVALVGTEGYSSRPKISICEPVDVPPSI
jgi:hypothetical protein